ncbi:serine protease [Auriscalpium vulgare]|uniref:Serine protease n=1 Tax=Auriscalpium vulgare TaxID=40419 RepID=A0ACB8S8Z2_9AGAM|nr:serine protease [Auriscalpium vulgare]
MLSSTLLAYLLITGSSALAAPSDTPARYIVQLKDGTVKSSHLASLGTVSGSGASSDWDEDVINGYAGTFDAQTLKALQASSDVQEIHEDVPVKAFGLKIQTDAPWGLQRISQHDRVHGNDSSLDYTYRYDSAAGTGVDIYPINEGIYVDNEDFGGRAKWGYTYFKNETTDGNGHGTHAAGSAAGTRFGSAKVKGAKRFTTSEDVVNNVLLASVAGASWVSKQVKASRRPSIASMSLGAPASKVIDQTVDALVRQGIHVIVAAGNENQDVKNVSPARVPTVVTVGASNINDGRAYFSNYGHLVDIFAPGENITSTYIGSPSAIEVESGTSMATPYVSGLVAYLISRDGNVAPHVMASKLKSLGTKNVLSNIPKGTVNDLTRNDIN